jgi:(p)ppGpp synthase/HD superfamily hydrolase
MGEFKLTQRQIKLLGHVQRLHNKHTQKRKFDERPYWTHPLSVARIVEPYGDKYHIEVALLHDIIEDTPYTEDDVHRLLRTYGYNAQEANAISYSVVELTDVFTHEAYPEHNRTTRKLLEANRLSSVSALAQTVKYADLIHNSRTIILGNLGFAKIYLEEKKHLLQVMDDGNIPLHKKAWRTLRDSLEFLKLKGK